ncbi:helix-turn-helix domain-containing protein [Muribaculum intestinale]|uniref:helix-turn-helix domain-containing protein n=1 Tax=Muribaculum intestinale TaxID=1796646 RepID=UPI00397C0551
MTNYSPVELIRRIRLKHGHNLIVSTDKTISEIAYETGFSTPAYFTKCYRDAYGETPTEVRNRLGK